MLNIWPHIYKELILLCRDRAGLLVLFVMPAILVIVVTLVQENVLKSMGESKLETVFVNMDKGEAGKKIEEALRKSGSFHMATVIDGKTADAAIARKAVARGDYQLAVVVSEEATTILKKSTKETIEKSLSGKKPETNSIQTRPVKKTDILIYFDPTLRKTVRTGLKNVLERITTGIETAERMKTLSDLIPHKMEESVKKAMGPMWSEDIAKTIPRIRMDFDSASVMEVREATARDDGLPETPNTVQQNVPAWTLFGMFFIVVPLGGSLIRERQSGMLVRLLTMPASYLIMLSGKTFAYMIICVVQFCLIMAVGKFFLPLLGTPALDTGSSPGALIIIALSASLAAAGYGILLGTLARTYEQASTFGAVSIVIAAALGGIMVPVYVMPGVMQSISVLSPLSWGLTAFLDVFVRGAGIRTILPDVALLLGFYIITTLLAWFYLSRKGRVRIQ